MCNSTNERKIRTAVDGLVQKGYMFTGFDITRFIRADGTRMRHKDVQDIITAMFHNNELTDYVRDTVDVGAPVTPFVYYHQYSDVSKYDKTWLDTNPTQTGMNDANAVNPANPVGVAQPAPIVQPAQPVSTSTLTTAPVKQKLPDGKLITKEGRLEIPNSFIKYMGINPGRDLALCIEAGRILVRTNFMSAANQYGQNYIGIKANNEGRVRICKRYLSKISSGNAFRVSQDGVGVVVAPY